MQKNDRGGLRGFHGLMSVSSGPEMSKLFRIQLKGKITGVSNDKSRI